MAVTQTLQKSLDGLRPLMAPARACTDETPIRKVAIGF